MTLAVAAAGAYLCSEAFVPSAQLVQTPAASPENPLVWEGTPSRGALSQDPRKTCLVPANSHVGRAAMMGR